MNTNLFITAHSGASKTQPNSMEYLRQACLAEPDIIEIDVRKTLDDKVVLSHNPSLDGSPLPIAALTYGQLLLYDPGLLLLESALTLCFEHGIRVNLDIKEVGAIPCVCAIIAAWDCTSQVIFTGCKEGEIGLIHQLLPLAKVLYNADSWDKGSYPTYSSYALAMVEAAGQADAFALNINCEYVQEELFTLARKKFLPIFVWTVETRALMRKMIGFGAASLTTKNIPLLKEELAYLEAKLSEH